MEYRHLTEQDIAQLRLQGCSASDWTTVQVHERLNLKYVRDTRFSGNCRLGYAERWFDMPGGIRKHSGVYHATLHDVTVGNDCCIENIKNYIARYDIGDNCFVENCDIILVDGPTSFGNGVEVAVLNETGGREVTIHDRLTANEAYLVAMYRHRPELVARLKGWANNRAEAVRSDRGTIANHCIIVDTGYIKNMYVGPYTQIEGAGRLKNGSLMSRQEAPVHIGYGVIADDFIVQDGSSVSDSTTLTRCYIGQACTLGHGYSASDSLFFCNCQEENGEACAIFAGPFTVTHHKSSLLIAGMFSFMNAGSGSNQSNHMYKLGPIHQGALERGAKTASDSYILWPARIGAFSLVMGRHSSNPDTSQMPFSYLIEKNGVTYLAPAVNLRSVGTIRDVQKWPKRDKRHPEGRLDQVNFNLLSPYTVSKMVNALQILRQLQEFSGATSDTYSYQSARITNSSLHRGIDLYTKAINKFLGNSLISRLEQTGADLTRLAPSTEEGLGEWVDLSGQIVPHAMLSELMDGVEQGTVASLADLHKRLADLHRRYYELEWTWAYHLMLQFYHLEESKITKQDLASIIRTWHTAVTDLDQMLYNDAKKEFNLTAKTGFGFDGRQSTTAEKDFEQVRGAFDTNPFVAAVNDHIERKTALAEKWLAVLE